MQGPRQFRPSARPGADVHPRFSAPPAPQAADPWDGVLYVDKPSGPTSHDVVDRIRRHFGIEKVGHGGTLDPMATGLLIVLLGRGTKLSMEIIGLDKTYEGTLRLGVSTDSHDADGLVVREADWSGVSAEQVRDAMSKLMGDLMQTPPMVSAVKLDGIPLYKRARKGEDVERKARLIHVYEFGALAFRLPEVDFCVRCTKGTYVRKLCADIGEAVGCGAHLTALRRTAIGKARIENALTMPRILALSREELLQYVTPLRKLALNP